MKCLLHDSIEIQLIAKYGQLDPVGIDKIDPIDLDRMRLG